MQSTNYYELNEKAKALFGESLKKSASLRRGMLVQALQMSKALLADCPGGFRHKVHKNVSIYSHNLLQCLAQPDLKVYQQTLSHYARSIALRPEEDPAMGKRLLELASELEPRISQFDREERVGMFHRLRFETLGIDRLKAFRLLVNKWLARTLFMQALICEENELSFISALNHYEHILECARECEVHDKSKPPLIDPEFCSDVRRHRARCSLLGDFAQLLNYKHEIVNESAAVLFDEIWSVIDGLQHIARCAEDVDQEISCKALFEVGVIYYQIIRDNARAHDKFTGMLKKATDPALVSPALLEGAEWFRKGKAFMNLIQKENSEDLTWDEKKQEAAILEQLKEQLDRVKQAVASRPVKEALEVMFKTFPHPTQKYKEAETPRKCIINMILVYHPDKNCKTLLKWRLVCRELTVLLNDLKSRHA